MNNTELQRQDDAFDLPAYLLGEIYGPMQVDGEHIEWNLEESRKLAADLKNHYNIDADPEEINAIMLEFDRQDTEDAGLLN